jgi:hypothetical protein
MFISRKPPAERLSIKRDHGFGDELPDSRSKRWCSCCLHCQTERLDRPAPVSLSPQPVRYFGAPVIHTIEMPCKSCVIQRRAQAAVKRPAMAGPLLTEFAWPWDMHLCNDNEVHARGAERNCWPTPFARRSPEVSQQPQMGYTMSGDAPRWPAGTISATRAEGRTPQDAQVLRLARARMMETLFAVHGGEKGARLPRRRYADGSATSWIGSFTLFWRRGWQPAPHVTGLLEANEPMAKSNSMPAAAQGTRSLRLDLAVDGDQLYQQILDSI